MTPYWMAAVPRWQEIPSAIQLTSCAAAFSYTAGELRYQVTAGNTYVMGDQNGDGAADFWIRVDGSIALVATDFVL